MDVEDVDLDLKTAKKIIKEAQKEHGDEPAVYEGDMPEDKEEIVDDAEQLVIQALEALEAGWDGESVTSVLDVADIDYNGASASSDDDEEEEEDDEEEEELEEPWDGYDDLKVSQLVKELRDHDEDELAAAYDYESQNKNRKMIIDNLETIAAEAEEEEEDDEGEEEELTYQDIWNMDRDELEELIEEYELDVTFNKRTSDDKLRERVEAACELEPDEEPDDESEEDEEEEEELSPPWRGYDKRTVEQILRKLPKLDEDELAEVFDYESANKDRKSIIEALEKLAEEESDDDDEEEEATEDDEGAEEGEGKDEGDEGSEDADAEEDAAREASRSRRKRRRSSAQKDEEAGYDTEHHELIADVTAKVEAEHLSPPERPPEDRVTIPFDLTECSDKEIRRLYSASRAYYARAAYIAKLEGQLAKACKLTADRKVNEIIDESPKVDPDTKKEKTATVLKAEAESDETVQMWRDRERSHSQISESLGKDAEIYENDMTALSREWTMRHEELEHSGSLPGKRKKS